jgi:hypothetical protein
VTQAVNRRLLGFYHSLRHVRLVEKVALGRVFSEYFGFPCHFSFHELHHIHLSFYHVTLYVVDADGAMK